VRFGPNGQSVSDINIQITWWDIALGLLASWFWPLTIAAVAAAVWVWRQRRSKLAWAVAVAAIGLWLLSGATNLATIRYRTRVHTEYLSDLRARQRTLATNAVVAGIRLPAGTVVTHDVDSSDIVALDLPAATDVRGVPVKGHVDMLSGGLHGGVQLARDARIGGVPCSARAPVRFELGKLTECSLSQSSRIRGIPCAGSVTLEPGVVCTLASDYDRFGFVWRAQTKITDYGDLVWFRIGANPPSLYVFGSPLAADAEVQFANGRIAAVDLRNKPMPFRSCAIGLILLSGGKLTGQAVGVCDIPEARPGPDVVLPSTTLSRHPGVAGVPSF
jgi:hypothetical protein